MFALLIHRNYFFFEWNTRKTYLNDLEEAGVPVIPTIYVDHVDEATLENAAAHFGVADLVVKPQVSASSHNIMRVLVGSDDYTSAPSKEWHCLYVLLSQHEYISGEINYYLQSIYKQTKSSSCIFSVLSILHSL
jgi:hypothetical protein